MTSNFKMYCVRIYFGNFQGECFKMQNLIFIRAQKINHPDVGLVKKVAYKRKTSKSRKSINNFFYVLIWQIYNKCDTLVRKECKLIHDISLFKIIYSISKQIICTIIFWFKLYFNVWYCTLINNLQKLRTMWKNKIFFLIIGNIIWQKYCLCISYI